MTWLIILHFAVGGVNAAVLPMEHRVAYTERADCARDIPKIRARWERTGLPSPERISCESFTGKPAP